MPEQQTLHQPILVAVWPGMGHVAVSAGYYLMSKLGMHSMAELSSEGLFDVDHVDVKDGLIQAAAMPRNRFFLWRDPAGKHDIVVFIGEAQPPSGKYAFCRRVVEFAKGLGVKQVFTFAAMATQMHPAHESRVFCAATSQVILDQLTSLDLQPLDNGNIGGLNGVLLGAAADLGIDGACLLGEMPHILMQLLYPKASLAVIRAFSAVTNINIDTAELAEQAEAMDDQLGELLARVEKTLSPSEETEEEPFDVGVLEEAKLSREDQSRIERLFEQAAADRSNAYELKAELDRLDVFSDYEDRFLDLFQKP